jgi:hypothetical protein
MPYHFSHSAMSDAEVRGKIDHLDPRRHQNSAACCMAMPLGVAKNTTSQAASGADCGIDELQINPPTQAGEHVSDRHVPASPRDVIASISTSGCCASRRSNSTPGISGTANNTNLDHARLPTGNEQPRATPLRPRHPELQDTPPDNKKPPEGGFWYTQGRND